MKQKIMLTMFALWLLLTASSEQIFALGKSSSAAQVELPTAIPETAVHMTQRINNYRTELGLFPYYQDQSLAQASQWAVDTMVATEFISHYDETGANPQQRAEKAGYAEHVTEIIFGGFGGADAAWEWWTENELHHELLTSEDYVEFGVATAVNEQSGRQYWAIMFGLGDGQYDTDGIAEANFSSGIVTKLPPAKSTSEETAVPAISTATSEPDPTATSEMIASVTQPENTSLETTDIQQEGSATASHESNTFEPNSLEESRWLIIAAVATIVIGIAVFYFPYFGLNQKFKERT